MDEAKAADLESAETIEPPINETEPGKDAPKVETEPKTEDAPPDETGKDEASWPDDWRERLAGDDEAFLRQLKRYSSPQSFAKGFKEREGLIRSGKLKRDMPDPSDEKAVAEWRKEQGIPDDPSGYVLPDEIKTRLTDADKPVLANFTEFAHKKGAPPAFVEMAAEWYTAMGEQAAAQQIEVDTSARSSAEEALRQEWPRGEYKANLTLASRYVESIPGVGKEWTEYRGPDGRRLGDNPEFIIAMADRGRETFGDSVFASPDAESRHNSRKAEIEAVLTTDRNKYYEDGLDKEYQRIIEAETKRRK